MKLAKKLVAEQLNSFYWLLREKNCIEVDAFCLLPSKFILHPLDDLQT
jgi:hypothetical protein